jgi:hypothetical protein
VLYRAFIFEEMMAGRTVEGWTSLMVVLLFLGAAQLVTMGSSANVLAGSTIRLAAGWSISSGPAILGIIPAHRSLPPLIE